MPSKKNFHSNVVNKKPSDLFIIVQQISQENVCYRNIRIECSRHARKLFVKAFTNLWQMLYINIYLYLLRGYNYDKQRTKMTKKMSFW